MKTLRNSPPSKMLVDARGLFGSSLLNTQRPFLPFILNSVLIVAFWPLFKSL